MTWYRITLTVLEAADGADARLMNQFGLLFIMAGTPEGAALFSARDAAGKHYYLTPEAGRIATSLLRRYGAKECSPPNPSLLRSLIGQVDLIASPAHGALGISGRNERGTAARR